MRDPLIAELRDMLTYARPADSPSERAFIARFIEPLAGAQRDPYGNWHVRIDDTPVLWSSHTDTVHRQSGRQTIDVDRDGIITLSKRSRKRFNCLGADCTVGVWIMVNMIRARVPGHYVFHYAEESGGIGSGELAARDPKFLRAFQMAIAFDRRGTTSIITHQAGGRCASDTFADSLAHAFAVAGLPDMKADDRGIFTDTANYIDDVPECSNISVGYYDEHTSRERLDSRHARRLLRAICAIDVARLTIDRDPIAERDARIADAEERYQRYRLQTIDRPLWDRAIDTTYIDDSAIDDDDPIDGPICRLCGSPDYSPNDDACNDCGEPWPLMRSCYLDPAFDAVQSTLRADLRSRVRSMTTFLRRKR